MWTPAACKFFFAAGKTDEESDALFLERYCSNQTRKNIAANSVSVPELRGILRRLALIAPDLDHSTPSWTTDAPRPAQLLVCIGRAHLQQRPNRGKIRPVPVVRQPRFGLCAIAGRVHFWIDDNWGLNADPLHPHYANSEQTQWAPWPGRPKKCYFVAPLRHQAAVQRDDSFAPDPLSEMQPLWCLIQELTETVREPSFVLEDAFADIRRDWGVPEEFAVIYPKLISGGDAIVMTPPESAALAGLTPESESSQVRPRSVLEVAVQEIADSLQLPDEQDATPATSRIVAGHCYVYALIDPRTERPFYVGKGTFDRAYQHFRNLVDGENDIPGSDDPDQTVGATPLQIMDAQGIQEGPETSEESRKISKLRELIAAGSPREDIARVLARGLSSQAAFAIESLLIKGVYGLDNLTNAVAGAHDARFREAHDWAYLEGFDLAATRVGALVPDDGRSRLGAFYVYVLRDPTTGEIFYVGKGKGARLCQHFSEAQAGLEIDDVPRLDRIKRLLDEGHTPKEIGRIVARVNTADLAFVLESFYMKFVVGFDRLLNTQPGHLSGLFRSRDDWKKRHGFDLPAEIKGQMRVMLRDMFLGEGLDQLLSDVLDSSTLFATLSGVEGPSLIGAGELAYRCGIRNVPPHMALVVQARCSRRLQIGLVPKNRDGQKWMDGHFKRLGLRLRRKDKKFTPSIWRGAANMTTDIAEAAQRGARLASLAQRLPTAQTMDDLLEYQDLLP
jgi:hypothetical protein